MFHKEDFGVDAKCHFFATSHGKSACDGVGAVVKYQARRASLQRTSENFITTPRHLFNFANNSLNGITALWFDESDVKKYEAEQEERMAKHAFTVPGTRSHHCFERSGNTLIGRRTSNGEISISVEYNFLNRTPPALTINCSDLRPGDYVAYTYDSDWYVGSVMDVDNTEQDIKLNSLHPKGPSDKYKYPARRDELYVPIQHIIKKVNLETTYHRQYSLSKADQESIIQVLTLH